MQAQILRSAEVLRLIGLSRATLWRMTKLGDFPVPVKLGRRCVGWRASEVQDWIESRPRAHVEVGK